MKFATILSLAMFAALSGGAQSTGGSAGAGTSSGAGTAAMPPARDRSQLPPGLANRTQMPPGLANRDQLPPGLEKRLDQNPSGTITGQSGTQSTINGSTQLGTTTRPEGTIAGSEKYSTNSSSLTPTSDRGSINRAYGTNSQSSGTLQNQSQGSQTQSSTTQQQSTTITQDRAVTQTDRSLLVQVRRAVQSQIGSQLSGVSTAYLPVHFMIDQWVVTLVGVIPDPGQRQQLVTLVEGVPGVTRVVDQLQVSTTSTTSSVGGTADTSATTQGTASGGTVDASQSNIGTGQSTVNSTITTPATGQPVLRGTNGLSDETPYVKNCRNANSGADLSPTSRTNSSINRVYEEDRTGSLPPGLQKRNELPPGLEKRDQLPPGLEKRNRSGNE